MTTIASGNSDTTFLKDWAYLISSVSYKQEVNLNCWQNIHINKGSQEGEEVTILILPAII